MCGLKDTNKIIFTLFVMTVMVAAVVGARLLIRRPQPVESDAPRKAAVLPPKAKGNPQAPLHVVEYSDFQCPACDKAAKILTEFYERDPSGMYVEFRHYPIQQLHPYAVLSAVFAECASRQGKFWAYHDLLFETRTKWSRSMRVRGQLMDMAQEMGIDMEPFEMCVDDASVETIVLEEKAEGKSRGISATPTYFINGKMVVGSRSLKEKLEELLGKEDL